MFIRVLAQRWFIVLAIGLLPVVLYAQWSDDPASNTPVRVDPNITIDVYGAVPDGNGGAFVFWEEAPKATQVYEVYAQYLDQWGIAKWPSRGKILSSTGMIGTKPRGISDSAGGMIICFTEKNLPAGNTASVRIMRIRQSGAIDWEKLIWQNEVLPSTDLIRITSDISGGAFILATLSDSSLCIQHIDSSGNIGFAGAGRVLANQIVSQYNKSLISDGSSGAFVSWADGDELRIQRVDTAGTLHWGSSGILVEHGSAGALGYNYPNHLAKDGLGGVFFVYFDRDLLYSTYRIKAHRFTATGNRAWGPGGVLVDQLQNLLFAPRLLYLRPGVTALMYQGNRDLAYGANPLLSMVDKNGKIMVFHGNPLSLDATSSTGGIIYVDSITVYGITTPPADGGLGATDGARQVRVRSIGMRVIPYPYWGSIISTMLDRKHLSYLSGMYWGNEHHPSLISDCHSGLIAVWHAEKRDPGGYEGLYAARMDARGELIPIELSSFTGVRYGSNVLLQWATISELHNAGFDVQRRFGEQQWCAVGHVPGAGNSNSTHEYTYTDVIPQNYVIDQPLQYRLRQIDYDGSSRFSPTITIDFAAEIQASLQISAMPNPGSGEVVVNISLPDESNGELSVVTPLGKVVSKRVRQFSKGRTSLTISTRGFTKGVYFLVLKANDSIVTSKLLVR